jgi:uncharacterized protein (TIGR02466 family)
MNIMGLFATPVVSDFYDCSPEVYEYLNNVEMTERWSGDYGNKSKNTYLLNEPELQELSTFILDLGSKVMGDVLGFDTDGVQFTQSWVSHKNPGEYHARHSHSNSIISGVYYFQKNIDQMPPITFYKHRSINSYELAPKSFDDNSQRVFAWDMYTYTPSSNNIILFPSYLMHSVSRNDTNETRKSIAFNIIPKHSFGARDALTELDFERLK